MEHDRARRTLEAERRQAVARLGTARQELDDLDTGRDANVDDEHDPEGPTIAFERARAVVVVDEAAARLAGVDRALARLAEGGYGRCQECGGAIGTARLEALPTAERCVACAAGTSSTRRR